MTLDEILAQAFTDGASDTMWQNDRHVEIFATAKAQLEALISDKVREAKIEALKSIQIQVGANLKEDHIDCVYRLVINKRLAELKKGK